MEIQRDFTEVAFDLEQVGLVWQPSLGDEVSFRDQPEKFTVIVDPSAMPDYELREMYLWLPKTEQLVNQLEARQAVLCHAGLELTETKICYRAVVQIKSISFEAEGPSLRSALGLSLRELLLFSRTPIQ
jgi:hypothetical protein